MAIEIKTWEIIDGELTEINTTLAQNGRKEKDDLGKWLKANPKILGDSILVFGAGLDYIRPLDYLGIDNNGNLVIVELKRDKLARDVLAQAIDYASDVANWDIEKLNEICLTLCPGKVSNPQHKKTKNRYSQISILNNV